MNIKIRSHIGLAIIFGSPFVVLGSIPPLLSESRTPLSIIGSLLIAALAVGAAISYARVELKGPLVAANDETITVRQFSWPVFTTIAWSDVQELKETRSGIYQTLSLVTKEGQQVDIPIFAITGETKNKFVRDLKAKVEQLRG